MASGSNELYGYDECIAQARINPGIVASNPDCVAFYALCKLASEIPGSIECIYKTDGTDIFHSSTLYDRE